MAPARLAAAAATLALTGAGAGGCGCGSDELDGAGPPGAGGAGRQLFGERCGSCHTLSAAGTEGSATNLDEDPPGRTEVLDAIEDGPGDMPAGLVSGRDAARVADYVASAAGR